MPRQRFNFEQFNPFRQPDWRWRLAEQVVSGEIAHRHGLDDAIRAAITFQRYEQLDTYPSRRRKGPHHAAIAAAVVLQESDDPLTWELRARLLAGQSDTEIAAQFKLSEDTVSMYDQLFFDVRSRLHAWAWISSQVFHNRLQHGFSDDDIGLIWQAIGYFGGAAILDAVIAATKACCRHGKLPTVSACLAEGSKMPISMQALLASMILPQTPELNSTYFEIHLRLLELPLVESDEASEAKKDRSALDVIKAARTVLAGKPIPQLKFRSGSPKMHGILPSAVPVVSRQPSTNWGTSRP